MKEGREWLIVVHYSNHWLELSMKDAFELDSKFKSVDQILLEMFTLARNSSKVKRLLKAVGVGLDLTCVSLIKAHGTRFQNHKYQAIKAFIINFLPVSSLFKNYIESGNEVCLVFSFLDFMQTVFSSNSQLNFVKL